MPTWPTTASDATHPFGTGLFYAAYGTIVAAAPALGTPLGQPWSEIGLMTRVTSPERTSGDTKATHLKSPNKAHEYLPGYVEGGTLTCRLLHSPATHAIVETLQPGAGTTEQRLAFAVQFSDGAVVYFNAYLKSSPTEVSDGDDPIAIDLTLKVSGDVFLVV